MQEAASLSQVHRDMATGESPQAEVMCGQEKKFEVGRTLSVLA